MAEVLSTPWKLSLCLPELELQSLELKGIDKIGIMQSECGMRGEQCVPTVSAGVPVPVLTGRDRRDDFGFPLTRTYRDGKKVVLGRSRTDFDRGCMDFGDQ